MGIRLRSIYLGFGVILFVLISSAPVYGKPQFDNDFFKKPDWFKKSQEEHSNRRDEFFKDFNDRSAEHATFFWIIVGVSIGVFVLIIACAICCFCIPTCFLAKSMANRRSTTYVQPHTYPTQPTNAAAGYPTQPAQAGYPYGLGQNNVPRLPFSPAGHQPSPYPPAAYKPLTNAQPATVGVVPQGETNGFNPPQPAFNPYHQGRNPTFQQPSQPDVPPPYPTQQGWN